MRQFGWLNQRKTEILANGINKNTMNQKIIKTIALTTTTTLMGSLLWLGGSSLVNNVALSSNVEDSSASLKSGNKSQVKGVRRGTASWYGPGFHGRRTANGERYNQNGLTAAHRSLPFGTRVRVTNLRNNRSVVVRINDRGPFVGGRIIDLSAGAAKQIGVYHSGLAPVKLEILGR